MIIQFAPHSASAPVYRSPPGPRIKVARAHQRPIRGSPIRSLDITWLGLQQRNDPRFESDSRWYTRFHFEKLISSRKWSLNSTTSGILNPPSVVDCQGCCRSQEVSGEDASPEAPRRRKSQITMKAESSGWDNRPLVGKRCAVKASRVQVAPMHKEPLTLMSVWLCFVQFKYDQSLSSISICSNTRKFEVPQWLKDSSLKKCTLEISIIQQQWAIAENPQDLSASAKGQELMLWSRT